MPNTAPNPRELDVQAMSASTWRIRDMRFSENDARSLIGFVEKKSEIYEVMQLGSGFRWFTYQTLAQAVAHFLEPSSLVGAENDAIAAFFVHGA